jgi:hypothetical protein
MVHWLFKILLKYDSNLEPFILCSYGVAGVENGVESGAETDEADTGVDDTDTDLYLNIDYVVDLDYTFLIDEAEGGCLALYVELLKLHEKEGYGAT